MPRVFSADDLLQDNDNVTIPVFIDTTSWNEFTDWAETNHRELKKLQQEGLRFWIFEDELEETEPDLYQRHMLDKKAEDEEEDIAGVTFEQEIRDKLGVQFHREKLPPKTDVSSKAFFYEVQEIYFHDVTNRERCDRHAEFVLLSRRAARSENKLRVLTAQPAFQRLVNAEIFLIPANLYKSKLPANFDVFTELEIHPKIRQKVELEFRRGNWSEVIFQAVDAFEAFLQEITGLGTDGGGLVNDVFNPNFDSRLRVAQQFPKLLINDFKLNDNSYVSEVNEQDGYFRYAQGVIKAIRNLGAHNDRNGTFIQSRYSDEKTAIKVLCFLSMICERIDIGKRHSP